MYGQTSTLSAGVASPAVLSVLNASWWLMTLITLMFVGAAAFQLVRRSHKDRP